MASDNPTKLFIADTNPRIVQILEEKLSQNGFQVVVVKTAKDIVIAVTLEDPDVVIANYVLPDCPDGNTLLAMIENIAGKEAVPVIFLTSKTDTGFSYSGQRTVGFVKKPYVFEELLRKIDEVKEKALSNVKKPSVQSIQRKHKGLALLEIIQVLAANNKTCAIELKTQSQQGIIFMTRGRIINATLGDEAGEETFYELFMWSGVDFFITDLTEQQIEKKIDKDMNSLILEAMNRAEE